MSNNNERYYTTRPELTAVAHAIRQKAGISEQLLYPYEFIEAVRGIPANDPPAKDVNFYDYDGRVVDSYTAEEFLALEALPANPSHEGLTAQGWNWELAAAQTYVQNYGSLEIGQMYTTSDGKTRAVIDIGDTEDLALTIRWTQSAANAVSIDWGDESEPETASGTSCEIQHTYDTAGVYVITMTVADGETACIGKDAEFTGRFLSQGSLPVCGREVLTALYIGAGMTKIGKFGLAFQSRLLKISIPQTVVNIDNRAFDACLGLKAIVIPKGCTAVGNYVFRCNYQLEVASLPQGLLTLGPSFMTCIYLKRVSVPEGVTAIGANTFQRCFSARVISIPDSVASFGNYAFESCYDLRKINVPSGVTAIPNYFARQCHNLTQVNIPEGVTSIGQMAFSGIFALADLEIPSTVTSIGKFAFLYNDGVGVFHVKATTPPTLEATALTSIGSATIYVPYSEDHSVYDAYLAATNWSNFGDIIHEEEAEEAEEEEEPV